MGAARRLVAVRQVARSSSSTFTQVAANVRTALPNSNPLVEQTDRTTDRRAYVQKLEVGDMFDIAVLGSALVEQNTDVIPVHRDNLCVGHRRISLKVISAPLQTLDHEIPEIFRRALLGQASISTGIAEGHAHWR